MRVIVVGAGLSGLSLAAMLRRLNVSCLLIEQKPDLDSQFELPYVLWSNALSCFRAFDIDQFMNVPGVEAEMYYGIRSAAANNPWLLRAANTSIDLEPMDENDRIPSSNAPTATSGSIVSRVLAEVHKEELAEVPRRITVSAPVVKHSLRAHVADVRFGRQVVGLRPSTGPTGGVTVLLDNGHVEWADIVVGADGMHSSIRQLVYPTLDSAHTHVSQNMTQIDGYTPVGSFPEKLGDAPAEIWGNRKTLSYLPMGDVDGAKYVAFSATLFDNPQELAASGEDLDPEVYRYVAAREFEEFGPEVTHVLKNAVVSQPTQLLQVPVMPYWHHRRAVLMGDAAHGAFPSVLNQDASLCVEDAALLATAISNIPFVRDTGYNYVFRTYEKARRQRIERYIRQSHSARNFAKTQHVAARDAALRITPGFAASWFQQWMTAWSYRGKQLTYDPYADMEDVNIGMQSSK